MDATLVERARSGDHAAFAELVAASTPRLFAAASLILRDRDRAEDAVQEAWLGAWRNIRALRDVAALEAWLHRLVVRACYRVARRERRSVVWVELRESDAQSDASGSLADRDQLDQAFRRLPVDQRAILVMHHYLDMPVADIADVLGIPVGTAKSRLHHGRRAMRAVLEADARISDLIQEGAQ